MAYTSSNTGNSQRQYGNKAPSAQAGSAKGFEKDPNEVGIAYEKTSEKGGKYFSVTILSDIPAGTKVMIFENKTKNRTEKTPTHVVKLSTKKQ